MEKRIFKLKEILTEDAIAEHQNEIEKQGYPWSIAEEDYIDYLAEVHRGESHMASVIWDVFGFEGETWAIEYLRSSEESLINDEIVINKDSYGESTFGAIKVKPRQITTYELV